MLFGSLDVGAVMVVCLLALLALAVKEDLLHHRVPNTLNAAGLLTGISLSALAGGWSGLVDGALGALAGFAAFVPFYLLRGMGAGDVKLMAVAGSFLGPASALLAAGVALVSGLVLATGIVVWRLVEARPIVAVPVGAASVSSGRRGAISAVLKERFPYAVAIGAGVLATLGWQGSLAGLYAALGIG